jgi:hypothetical protein
MARFLVGSAATISLLFVACSNGDQSPRGIERTKGSDVGADAGTQAGIVEQFIGLEYTGRPPAERFGGVHDYSSPIDPNEPAGYSVARMIFDETYVYLLQRTIVSADDGQSSYVAVDGFEVALGDGEALPGNGIECFRRGGFDPEVIAVADTTGAGPHYPAVRAWRLSRATERVEAIEPTDVECVVLGDY